jgi:hypothetical protein
MNQIDDLGHCGLLSAFSSRRMRELNALPIAQQSARQKQVVDICRRSLEIIRLHIGREGPLSRAMGVVGALIWCLQTRGRSRACRAHGTVPTSHKTHQMLCLSPAASLPATAPAPMSIVSLCQNDNMASWKQTEDLQLLTESCIVLADGFPKN